MLGIGITYDQNKTEAVWLGSNAAPLLNLETKEEIKLLGLTIINTKCAEHNWGKKEQEIKSEIKIWRISNYKTRIQIITLVFPNYYSWPLVVLLRV